MGPLARLGVVFRRGFGRVTPDPFVLAVALSILVLIVAIVGGDWPAVGTAASPDSLLARVIAGLDAWGNTGLWKLLAFAMQMVLMLMLGTALAEAPIVRRGIAKLARLASGPRSLVAITAAVSIALALLSWSLSLIGGAILAREGGRQAKLRGWKFHYPIACAAAYSGLMCWHGGLSGTAPLKATTEKDMVEVLGPALAEKVGTIALDYTLFSNLNLFVTGGLIVLGPLLFAALTPREGSDPAPQEQPETIASESLETPLESPDSEPPPADALERIERSPIVIWALALPLLAALIIQLMQRGLGHIGINTINLGLLILALMLHGRPHRLLAACAKGIQGCTGIVLQFPLYAGIMALMAASGLSAVISSLASAAGPEWLAPLTFLSAGLLNLFVPSGGGQWAVQGPIIMKAAHATGIAPGPVLMAMAYGDQWTNMLQPFWALPLLAVTGVRARDIVGYTALWMLAGGAWIILGLVLWA